jgi:hypothetical protein
VQALDRLRVLWRFGQYGNGEIAHGGARDSIWRRRGPLPAALNPALPHFLLIAGCDR